MAQPDSCSTGHVKLIERKSGPKFYAKYRLGEQQTTRLIGPAWLKRGRAPEGHFTKAMAEVELHRMMADARIARVRSPSGSSRRQPSTSATSSTSARSTSPPSGTTEA
jgi:hypothetical protein